MRILGRLLTRPRRFGRDEEGAVLVETIVILPVMIVFLVGILEFGALLYNKMHVETGLRDAARYLSRCNGDLVSAGNCNAQMARNIAVFGNPAGTGTRRVPGWTADADTIAIEGWPTDNPADAIRVSTSFQYPGSPLIGLIGFASLPVAAYHDERFMRW